MNLWSDNTGYYYFVTAANSHKPERTVGEKEHLLPGFLQAIQELSDPWIRDDVSTYNQIYSNINTLSHGWAHIFLKSNFCKTAKQQKTKAVLSVMDLCKFATEL